MLSTLDPKAGIPVALRCQDEAGVAVEAEMLPIEWDGDIDIGENEAAPQQAAARTQDDEQEKHRKEKICFLKKVFAHFSANFLR